MKLSMLLSYISMLFLLSCSPLYDILIVNACIYDGVDTVGYSADIGIVNGEIVEIGDLRKRKSKKVIDAEGMVVCPGFIDLHAHIESIMSNPRSLSALHQGVTTVLGGPDGRSPYPLGEHLAFLSSLEIGVNVAYLIGHNTIRREVMGLDNRVPTPMEINKMKEMVEVSMKEGAFGMSTGLKYLPGTFSEVEEVIELAAVASEYYGFYTSHLREEGLGLIPAVKEAIMIGEKADIPIVLTHHKVVGEPSWGNSIKTLFLVDSANQAGLDVQIDQYPYTASYTSISILIPSWAMSGGQEKFMERIGNKNIRDSIRNGIVYNILNDRGAGDINNVQLSRVPWNPKLENKRLSDWAFMKGLEPTPEVGADLIIEAQINGGASAIFHAMNDDDVERIMKHPKTMIASDGQLSIKGKGHPHPRAYGTFPRVLGKYVREKNLLVLGEAIKKMTSLPAKRLGLEDRGQIKEGYKADLVIFDPKVIEDRSNFDDPHQYPVGIHHVMVNGVLSIEMGEVSSKFNGEILRRVN